jgi:hypothetical protein
VNWFTHIPFLPMVNACLGLTRRKRREDRTGRKPRPSSYLTQGGNPMSDVAADKPGIKLFLSEHACSGNMKFEFREIRKSVQSK